MKTGWTRIYRQIEDNPIWLAEKFTRGQAWIDLIIFANHKDGFFYVRGNRIDIKRGQIGWSEVTMAKRWQWSRNKVRGFLKMLENEQQIKQHKSTATSVTTILNYNKYQSKKTADGTAERQQKDSRRNTNKNVKNVKNDKKEKPQKKKQVRNSLFDDLPLRKMKEIASDKRIKLSDVKHYKQQYILWIKEKPTVKARTNRVMSLTVQSWINRDIQNNRLEQTKTEDDLAKETGMVLLGDLKGKSQ